MDGFSIDDVFFMADKIENEIECVITEEKRISSNDFFDRNWRIKDTINVDIGEKSIPFRVEHIKDNFVYFVSVNILEKLPHDSVNEYLDNLYDKFPSWLKRGMCDIHHKNDNGEYKRQISMLSSANVGGRYKEYCYGEDDIAFEGLKTYSSRCKDIYGETYHWWLDTAYPSSSSAFMNVYYNGYPNNYGYATYYFGVACAFKVRLN